MPKTIIELQNFLNTEIPTAQFMEIEVRSYDGKELCIQAPLRPNTNHHGTAFGGAIASLGFICGWAYIHLRMQQAEIKAGLVIHKTEVEFIAPVKERFEARVCLQNEEQWQNFTEALALNAKARLQLTPRIYSGAVLAAQLRNSYAAFSST